MNGIGFRKNIRKNRPEEENVGDFLNNQTILDKTNKERKGKPAEKLGRKTTGLTLKKPWPPGCRIPVELTSYKAEDITPWAI